MTRILLSSRPTHLLPIAAIVAGLTLCAPSPRAQQQVPDTPVLRVAMREMQRLQAEGGMVSPKTFSRYFAVYSTPEEPAQAQRLLGTAERVIRAFARKLYVAAEELARQDGAPAIGPDHLRAIAERWLPSVPTEFKTWIFFPTAEPAQRLEVESIDVEAFGRTPFVWPVLLSLTVGELAAGELLPIAGEEAARRLGDAVATYGLLVFRLAGNLAREELAAELTSPHLRQAEKELARLPASRASGARAAGPPKSTAVPPPIAAPAGSRFVDVSAARGVRFRHVSSDWISHFRRYGPLAPTYSGGGVTASDLDGDGRADLIFSGGEGCGVFLARADGTFADVTAASGLHVPGEARMALAADFDNDGDADVFLTYARDTNRLFENLGGGRFRDVTDSSGMRREGDISGPAVAVDYDNDGLLDVYVGNFGNYLDEASPWQALDNKNGMPNRLYRNLGGLRFEDTTERAGVGDTGWSQALSHADVDRDGDQDLYVANDFGTNDLLLNRGDGTFAVSGEATGSNDPFHGMNVAFTDLNRDTLADILVTNIWGWIPTQREPGEYNTFLLSRRSAGSAVGWERDVSRIPGLVAHDTGWSWAGLFFDADLDGDDDLFLANGLTDYSTFLQWRLHPSREGQLYPISNRREKNVFFLNDGGILRIPAEPSGAELGDFNSRSLALLDVDFDGDLDLAVTTFHAWARLFRNDGAPAGRHWLTIELVGDPSLGTPRDAIGAQVIGRGRQGLYVWRTVTGGEGYLGMSTLAVEMGLGPATAVDLEIMWPGGTKQELEDVPANQTIRVHQGRPGFERVR